MRAEHKELRASDFMLRASLSRGYSVDVPLTCAGQVEAEHV